ncbi:MAG: hypothetical protein KAG99_10855 [Bacteroidales bacterium]|nr:hypothetical protein [Bacteroidales bacterium]
MNRRNKIQAVTSLVIIAILLSFQLISIQTRHSHILPSGEKIWHSHPYSAGNSNSPFESHHHTKNEIALFCMFGKLLFINLILFFVYGLFRNENSKEIKFYYSLSIKRLIFFLSLRNRAPPVLIPAF